MGKLRLTSVSNNCKITLLRSFSKCRINKGRGSSFYCFLTFSQFFLLKSHRCFSDVSQCVNGYSFAIWLKLGPSMSSDSSDGYVMSSGGQTSKVNPGGMKISVESGGDLDVGFRLRSVAKRWQKLIENPGIDEWVHITATWNKDGYLTVYVNGTKLSPVGNTSYTPSGSVNSDIHIGKPNNAVDNFAEVTLDEWYVWDEELTEEQVENIFRVYSTSKFI